MGTTILPPNFMREFEALKRRLANLEAISFQTLAADVWQPISFAPDFADLTVGGNTLQPTTVARDQNGQVHLRGIVAGPNPTTSGTTFGWVPSSLLPTESDLAVYFPITVVGGGVMAAGYFQVNATDGAMKAWWTESLPVVTGLTWYILGHQTYR